MLSIIIPSYNEEKIISRTLTKIIDFLDKKDINYEIIVADDGSKDKTREIVKKFNNARLTKKRRNKGKGYSVKQGVMLAKGDYILFSDADLSTPIEELDKFMNIINKGYDIVIASRNLKESIIPVKQPFFRRILGKTFPLLVNFIILPGFKDTQCGFKLFKKETAKKIFKKQTLNGFSFDVELLFIAKRYNYKIKEAPVTWSNALDSKVNPINDSMRMFLDILKIRLNNIKGRYD